MNTYGTTDTVLDDYDDSPGRRVRNPFVRLFRTAGALLTILVAMSFSALLGIGIVLPLEVYLGSAFVCLASIPLIMLFWSEEVDWKGGWLTVAGTVAVISILTLFAEVLLSAGIIVSAVVIFRP